jgi:hypothetical protein
LRKVRAGIFLVHWNGGFGRQDESAKQSISMISLHARTRATTKADSSAALRNDNKTTGNKETGNSNQQIPFGDDS